MKYQAFLILALVTVNAAAETKSTVQNLPRNMMAQFYGVPESQVSVYVAKETRLSATVIAYAPRGNRCTFNLVRAPEGSTAPSGWITAPPECVTQGGGIGVVDCLEPEKAR